MKPSKSIIIIGIAFGALSLLIDFILEGEASLRMIISATLSAGLFMLLFSAFIRYMHHRISSIEIPLTEGEKVLKAGPANWMVRNEGVGGKLVITDQRFIFRPTKLNIQYPELSVLRDNVKEVSTSKSWGLLNNTFQIRLSDDNIQKFVVYEPGEWREALR